MAANEADMTTVCRLLDITPQWLGQLIRRGIIPPPVSRGVYALVPTIQGYIHYLRDAAEAVSESYADERARLTKAKADIAEMEKLSREGELLPFEQTLSAIQDLFIIVKSRFLGIPAQARAKFPLFKNGADLETWLRDIICEICGELSRFDANQIIGDKYSTPSDDGDGELEASDEADGERLGRKGKISKPGSIRRTRQMAHGENASSARHNGSG